MECYHVGCKSLPLLVKEMEKTMTMLQTTISIVGLIISCGTLCTMMYGFFKFLSKPHDTLEQRVTALESWQTETNARLKHGSDKFEAQDKANEIILRSVLALI